MPFLISDTRSLNAFAVEMLTRLGIYQYTCHLQLVFTSTRRELNGPSLNWLTDINFRSFVTTVSNFLSRNKGARDTRTCRGAKSDSARQLLLRTKGYGKVRRIAITV
jgi:hypothetical protein